MAQKSRGRVHCRLCPNGARAVTFATDGNERMPQAYWEHTISEHPLNCTKFEERLPAYFNGGVAYQSDQRAQAHIIRCGCCRKNFFLLVLCMEREYRRRRKISSMVRMRDAAESA